MKTVAEHWKKLIVSLWITQIFISYAQAQTIPVYNPLEKSVVANNYQKVLETGNASWYGPGYENKQTASGEIFNGNSLTAAHPHLPFNAQVKVTNLDNNRSVVVRINDRGPNQEIHPDRVIDLTEKVADLLDMKTTGVARVQLELISSAISITNNQGALSTDWQKPSYAIQIASYFNKAAALHRVSLIPGAWIQSIEHAGMTLHRVFYGKFDAKTEANENLAYVRNMGYESAYVKQVQNIIYESSVPENIATFTPPENVPSHATTVTPIAPLASSSFTTVIRTNAVRFTNW